MNWPLGSGKQEKGGKIVKEKLGCLAYSDSNIVLMAKGRREMEEILYKADTCGRE